MHSPEKLKNTNKITKCLFYFHFLMLFSTSLHFSNIKILYNEVYRFTLCIFKNLFNFLLYKYFFEIFIKNIKVTWPGKLQLIKK